MAIKNYILTGTLRNINQEPLADLRVEAYDLEKKVKKPLGDAVSDAKGVFSISIPAELFKKFFDEVVPQCYFKIYKKEELIFSTEKTEIWNSKLNEKLLDITVDHKSVNTIPKSLSEKISFSGTVKHSQGNAINKIKVVLNEQQLRDKKKISETLSDEKGFYSFKVDRENKTYFVEVVDDGGKSLVNTKLIFNPAETEVHDLVVNDERYLGKPGFEQKISLLNNYFEQLNAGDEKKDLSIGDIYFVAKQTEQHPKDAFHWLRAKEMESTTSIPAEAFYGIFKEGLPTNPKNLSSFNGDAIKTAVENAVKSGHISSDIGSRADTIVNKWSEYIAGKVLDDMPAKMDSSIGDILSVAVSSKETQKKILTAYLEHKGTAAEFWQGLGTITGDEKSAGKIQSALKLSVLTGNQKDMLTSLTAKTAGADNPLHQLAEMDQAGWVKHISDLSAEKGKSVVPPFIEAAKESDRVNMYAKQMALSLEKNFPTQSFFGKLKKQPAESAAFSAQDDMLKFFKKNPSFDIKKTPTLNLLKEDSGFVFDGVQDKKKLVQQMQSAQRLSSYSDSFGVMNTMMSMGMDSAFNIVSMPEETFVTSLSNELGSVKAAAELYATAEKRYMASMMYWSMANPNLSFKTATTPPPIADPTLRTMFGTLDACECEHCTSVFSPAAYYTDILNFLYSRTPDVYEELMRRRPDLAHIELTCENTNTPLPYVDLVNELLENFILTHKTPATAVPSSYQTTLQALELAANPEHLSYPAYDELKKEVYPHLLPFNLPVEESRVYLKHLGVQKHQLMATFFAGTSASAFDDFNINMERLQLSLQEGKILSGETTGNSSTTSGVWNFYGFDKSSAYRALTDPADSSKQISGGNWDVALTGRVDVFLQQTELSYKELLSLLLCNSINTITGAGGVREIQIVSIDGDNASCRLDNLKLTGVTATHLQKIHRFLRLWRTLDWDIYDLDKAAVAFQLDFGNDSAQNKIKLIKIAQCDFLCRKLKLKVENMLVCWSNISTASYINYAKDNYPPVASLYEKLFCNKAVINPVDAAFADPAALAGTLDDHVATIVAALQISDEDYSYLKTILPDNNLTLVNLSELYRHALLSRKLKLSCKDFLLLKKLIGSDFKASPLATFEFLSKTDTVKSSGFSIDQLNYLLRHDYLEETGIAPADTDISVFLSEVRSSLRAIESGTADEQRNTIVQKFSEKFKITTTAAGMLMQNYVKGITKPAEGVVEDFRSDDFSTFSFLKTYTDTSDPANPKDYEPVFVRANPAADSMLDAELNLFNDYMRIEKIAAIISKLKLSDTDLEIILKHSAAMQCTDIAALPVTATGANFALFETLINLIRSRDMMPVGSPDALAIVLHAITGPDKTKWMDDLITRSNWDKTSVEALVGDSATVANGGILKTNFPADYVNGNILLQVKTCLSTQNKIGLKTSLIKDAIATDFDNTVSEAIKNAAKSKYDETQWLKLAKPLRDDLREKQRRALVAFVVTHSDFNPATNKFERWKNSDELYEYLLIDVEMKPISMTSRIKQAICSVQLYIDRVLMNLEHPDSNPLSSPLKLEGAQVEEWNEWRKIYRVWEANRKIFLYPENWIEPELRDDKSPFFKDLETVLKQNELNEENIESGFHGYLEKLDEVARLEVVGLYHQVETNIPDEDGIDILHVFGRTHSNPHKYFHRTLENNEWTAWQKLEIDIDGDHIIPTIFNRKLCLFWLFFTEETEEQNSLNPEATVNAPKRWLKIQVAWSELRKGKWTAKKLSKSALYSDKASSSGTLESNKRNYWMHTKINDDKLYIYLTGTLYNEFNGFVFNNTNTDPVVAEVSLLSTTVVNVHQSIQSTYLNYQMIKANAPDAPFQYFIEYDDIDGGVVISTETIKVLQAPKENNFSLVTPSNERGPHYSSFFFQDAKNTFYVLHSSRSVPVYELPDFDFKDWELGLRKTWPFPGPIGPDVDPAGPIFDLDELINPVRGIDDFFLNDVPDIHDVITNPGNDFSIIINDNTGKLSGFEGVINERIVLRNTLPGLINERIDTGDLSGIITGGGIGDLSGGIITDGPGNLSGGLTGGGNLSGGLTGGGLGNLPGGIRGGIRNLPGGTIGGTLGNLSGLIVRRNLTGSVSGTAREMLVAPESGPAAAQPAMTTFALGAPEKELKYFDQLRYSDQFGLARFGKLVVTKYKDEHRFLFNTFYHAHVKKFVKELYKLGIDGLLKRAVQTQNDTVLFEKTYTPFQPVVQTPFPTNEVDFSYGSAYSQYNWELFFHVPMLIACRLKDDQRFEEARKWFHYIFDPTKSEGGDKERFWQFRDFHELAANPIETLDQLLHNEAELSEQVDKWMADPFKPHVIARMRKSAYMKNVVMKYLDNLISWGDNLFRRDTIEAINEATNLYILAAKILGERPQNIPPRAEHGDKTFDDLKDDLDPFSNALVQIETMIAPSAAAPGTSGGTSASLGEMFYFCVPRNEFLMKYWDTVADRLYKIRNSMNIEGVVRMLPLFEPPIDPAMLVRAAAAGMDLSSILSDMSSPLPHYRFTFMVQKAHEFINEVKSLGSALLQALEKRDGEAMALLRSTHENKLLSAILSVKEKQVEDAKMQVDVAKKSKQIAQLKYDYYSSRKFMNSQEKQALDSVQLGMVFSIIQGELNTIGGVLSAIPNLKAGAPTSMGVTWGGDNLGAMMNAISTYMGIFAAINNAQGSMAGTLGGYTRRMDDWKFQASTSSKELEQLDMQILSSEIKLAIAEKDLLNQQLQIENNQELDEFMRSKFTNQQLYDWMTGQISTVYFQSYQLAYDLAKKAEKCYQHELGEYDNTSFVQFGYWDSLKKGLMSAEKMQYDVRRMESSFYENNKRELELTKHISSLLLNPQAILELRENGSCVIQLPEAIFDLDFQGHYFRRIKAISISIPCIAGPYTTINATLRLRSHTTRIDAALNGGVYESDDYSADARFHHVPASTASVSTSSAQNDSGMFELNFRDERFLPFEGCGSISEWQLELTASKELRMFDYNTISDVILTMRYTAREDAVIKDVVAEHLKEIIETSIAPTNTIDGLTLTRIFKLKQEFSSDWYKFLHPSDETADQVLDITLKKEQFPYFTQDKTIVATKIEILLKSNTEDNYKMIISGTSATAAVMTSSELLLGDHAVVKGMKTVSINSATGGFNLTNANVFSKMSLKFKNENDADYHSIDTSPEELVDVFLIVHYGVES